MVSPMGAKNKRYSPHSARDMIGKVIRSTEHQGRICPGVGHKIVSDTKQITKERKKKEKKMSGKREKCVKKKMEEREREKWTEINEKR